MLDRKVSFNTDDGKKKLTIREGLVHKLLELSNSGDGRAMDWIHKIRQHVRVHQPPDSSDAINEQVAKEFSEKWQKLLSYADEPFDKQQSNDTEN